ALLGNKRLSLEVLSSVLNREGVATVFRQNADGLIYGITYIDHRTKCVFNGSSLGKKYSANAIQRHCQQDTSFEQKKPFQQPENQQISQQDTARNGTPLVTFKGSKNVGETIKIHDIGKVLDKLMQPENPSEFLPYQLKNSKKKKKRKKGIYNNQ